MLDRFAVSDPVEEDRFFLYPIRREHGRDWLPDNFVRHVTKEPLSGSVPRPYSAVQVHGDDRIVGRLDDSQPRSLRPMVA
jgi:hypothetical protein